MITTNQISLESGVIERWENEGGRVHAASIVIQKRMQAAPSQPQTSTTDQRLVHRQRLPTSQARTADHLPLTRRQSAADYRLMIIDICLRSPYRGPLLEG